MNRPPYKVIFGAPAERDFLEIMDWSIEHFGADAADRYESLIGQALTDIGEDPFRPGAVKRPELPESVYTYHLAISRKRVSGGRVHTPRHFVLYRVVGSRVEVLRLLHDSRDLAQHVLEA